MKKMKGTRDYFGYDSKKINYVFNLLDETSKEFGYEKIITPTFEVSELFTRTVGNDVDVVNKEMYTFSDKKGRSLSLRPEGTAGATRLALENKLIDNNQIQSFYYISNMFRYERPQKGRQREFFQFGVERYGEDCLMVDTEVIQFGISILNKLNIDKYELQINSIGSSEDRIKYNDALKEFTSSRLDNLSDYAKEKYNSDNIFRIFDTKNDNDLEILKDAPSMIDFLSKESLERFKKIKLTLRQLEIKFIVNDKLVRGLDYYNDLVFEFVSTDEENLGSKSTIIGGGRYNKLVNKIDSSKDVPAVGFALGIERLILASDKFLSKNIDNRIDYYIATAHDELAMDWTANRIAFSLRNKSYSVIVDYRAKKLSKKYDRAKEIANKLIIVGNEIKDGNITIKDLKTNETIEMKIGEI